MLSTGVIGAFLPMDKIEQGIAAAAVKLGDNEACLDLRRPRHVDHRHRDKLAGRSVTIGGREIQVTGMAKGAAMMGPNMATMLALIMTDAPLDPAAGPGGPAGGHRRELQLHERRRPHEHQRHRAPGGQRRRRRRSRWPATTWRCFRRTLDEVCVDLAKAIAGDGEGATHLITIDIGGCADRGRRPGHRQDRGQQPAGQDGHPRRRSQLGPHRLGRRICGRALRSGGRDAAPQRLPALSRRRAGGSFDGKAVSNSIRDHRDTHIELAFSEGTPGVRFWTADLTAEYVRLNADYHT